MNGAEFIRRVRKLARRDKTSVRIVRSLGNGSHMTVYLGEGMTIVQDLKKELTKGTFGAMCKQLGIDPKDL